MTGDEIKLMRQIIDELARVKKRLGMLDTLELGSASYTNEDAQDAVGTILTGTTTIDFIYTDATPSITADVKTGSVNNTLLANMAQSTIKGRASAAGTGDPEDLSASQARAILNVASGADVTATAITALAAKTTPVDTDYVVITDSADSQNPKRTLWSNIKATLKTYFDTLYGALASANTWSLTQTFSAKPIVNANLGVGSGTNSNIVTNSDDSVMSFVGGTATTEGAYVALAGVAHATDVVRGRLQLVVNTKDSTTGGTLSVLSYNGVSTFANKLFMSRAGLFGFGGVTVPAAQVHVDQSSTTGAIPVLTLDQGDTDEDFIELIGTSGAGTTTSISTQALGTYRGKFMITVNGTKYFVPYYD